MSDHEMGNQPYGASFLCPACRDKVYDVLRLSARPNAHATISGNSFRQNAPPCAPARSSMTTSAPASRSATAHLVAFSRKNGSCVPATRYVRGIRLGIPLGGL